MSKYSGKSDLFDSLHTDDYSKLKIFAHSNDIVPLRIDSYKEVVPYFPYLVSISCVNADGYKTIYLSSKSFVDIEEEELLTCDLDILKRYHRKCKRNKTEFNEEEALSMITLFGGSDLHKELVRRVKELGSKATIEGIHIPQCDRMRESLYEEMIRVGWTEYQAYRWCFGWDRWLERSNADKYGEGTVQQRLPV